MAEGIKKTVKRKRELFKRQDIFAKQFCRAFRCLLRKDELGSV